LVAFCDAEAGAGRSRRAAKHLAKCDTCRDRLQRIRGEKDALSAGAPIAVMDSRRDLAEVLSAIAGWRGLSGAASELRRRLQRQIETYCGAPALLVVQQPGVRAEELLGKTGEILEVFLGPAAAEALSDDVLRGLDWAVPAAEISR